MTIAPRSHIPSRSLNITQQVIDAAVPGVPSKCMYAIAIRKQIPGACSVEVDRHYMIFTCPGVDRDGQTKLMRYTMPTPPKCVANILQFDGKPAQMVPHKITLRGDNNSAFAEPSVTKTFLMRPDGAVVKRRSAPKSGRRTPPKPRRQSPVRVRNCMRRYSPDSTKGVVVVTSQPTRVRR